MTQTKISSCIQFVCIYFFILYYCLLFGTLRTKKNQNTLFSIYIMSTSSSAPSSIDPLRIGILGCANIAKKNAIAILEAPQQACCIHAVASRNLEKAEAFCNVIHSHKVTATIKPTTITRFGGSTAYDNLIQSAEIDAVYIPLPTALHKEWVLKALQNGKHVLLEKPVAVVAQDYEEMLQVAKEHQKFLMDGTMFVHHPRTDHFVRTVQDRTLLGQLVRLEAGFSFCGDDGFLQNNVRVKKDGDLLGCLGDLGWYVVRLALLVVGPEAKLKSAHVTDYQVNDCGIPIDTTCLVHFSNNVVLSFHCGFKSHFRQYVKVVGTKAGASMNDFVLPKLHPVTYQIESMGLTEFDLITEHEMKEEEFDGPVQEALMWDTFARLANAIDAEGWTGTSEDCQQALNLSRISTENQKILDALMTSIAKGGVKVEFP